MIILLILAVLYLYLHLFIARKIEKKNIELLEYRFKQIKNSLRKILEELDDMQTTVPVDRIKQVQRDIYHQWLFEEKVDKE